MKYKSGYRYKLDEAYLQTLPFSAFDCKDVPGGWVSLDGSKLYIVPGYAWDGASTGLPWTPKKWLRPSLVHDALYQLIREGHLPMERRKNADEVFYQLLRENLTRPLTTHLRYDVFIGMRNLAGTLVALIAYYAVRLFGNYCLRKGKPTKEAP
jgi:hypothetical protein